MCTADITPITFVDMKAFARRPLPMPDFSTLHTCRDFDAILDWSWKTDRFVEWEDIGNSTTFRPVT